MPGTPLPVCGTGAICAAGNSPMAAFGQVCDGRDNLRPLALFESGLKEAPLCAQIDSDLENLVGQKAANRTLALGLVAARQAVTCLADAAPCRLGLAFATTVAGISRSEQFYRALLADPDVIRRAGTELSHHEPTALAGTIARDIGACGIHSVSTACSTGLHAVWLAAAMVDNGTYDACLALGADALSLLAIRGFASLTLLDPHGCRPFDAARAGISLGEGAGALLVVSNEYCTANNLSPCAHVHGWGATADCHHMTAPHPEGDGAYRSMKQALGRSGVLPESLDLIVTHGTGTPDNDLAESKAIKRLFAVVPPFCSMKRTLGHTLAASGTLEAVFAIMAMNDKVVPATGGFTTPDNALGISPSPGQKRPVCFALKNAFGFGGNNVSIVLSGKDL